MIIIYDSTGRGYNEDQIANILKEIESRVVGPPAPPLMRVGVNLNLCPICGSGMKPNWFWFKSKGCFQPKCSNYYGDNK